MINSPRKRAEFRERFHGFFSINPFNLVPIKSEFNSRSTSFIYVIDGFYPNARGPIKRYKKR